MSAALSEAGGYQTSFLWLSPYVFFSVQCYHHLDDEANTKTARGGLTWNFVTALRDLHFEEDKALPAIWHKMISKGSVLLPSGTCAHWSLSNNTKTKVPEENDKR